MIEELPIEFVRIQGHADRAGYVHFKQMEINGTHGPNHSQSGCKLCGAVVFDAVMHAAWHTSLALKVASA